MTSVGNIVFETAAGTGTGDLTLAAMPYYRRFSDAFGTGSGNTFYYCIRHQSANEYEVGVGYCSSSNTLVRSSVIESSNSNALVNFTVGDKDIINDVPASLQLIPGAKPLGSANTFPTVNGAGTALNYVYATNQSLQTVDNVTFNSVTFYGQSKTVQQQLDEKLDLVSYTYFGGR